MDRREKQKHFYTYIFWSFKFSGRNPCFPNMLLFIYKRRLIKNCRQQGMQQYDYRYTQNSQGKIVKLNRDLLRQLVTTSLKFGKTKGINLLAATDNKCNSMKIDRHKILF